MSEYAPHELLDLHEWVDSCARTVKMVRQAAPAIQDQELRRLADACESSSERAIGEAQHILQGR